LSLTYVERVILDCHDFSAMVATVAAAIERSPEDLVEALREDEGIGEHDEFGAITERTLGRLGVQPADVRFSGTCWFHGTRTLDPERYKQEGLLPQPRVADWLWEQLGDLVRDDVSKEDWQAFRESIESDGGGDWAHLYRLKRDHDPGPLGELVREVVLKPRLTGSHDYLGMPETVEDIAAEAHSEFGIDLAARYETASVPCIVKFRTNTYDPRALHTAFAFGHAVLTAAAEWSRDVCRGHSMHGQPVAPEDVLAVEVVSDRC
jgi:hypothetical protein